MRHLMALAFASFLFASCQTGPDRAKLVDGISRLEAQIGNDPKAQAGLFENLMSQYESYAASYPEDDESSKYLIKAGELARLNQQFDKAIAYYEQIISSYPNSTEAPKALFMKGFTLDNDLENIEGAKAVYEEFLSKYPNDDFADDTEFLLKNLGKSEEEILKQFEGEDDNG